MPDHGNRPLTFPVLGCWRPSLLHAASNSGHANRWRWAARDLVFPPPDLFVSTTLVRWSLAKAGRMLGNHQKMLFSAAASLVSPKHTDVTSSSCHRFCLSNLRDPAKSTQPPPPSWRLAQPPSLPVSLQRCRSPKGHTRGAPLLAPSGQSKKTQPKRRYGMPRRTRRIKVR